MLPALREELSLGEKLIGSFVFALPAVRGVSDPLVEERQDCRFYFYCSGPKRASLEARLGGLPVALRESIHLGDGLDQAA